MSKAKQEKYSSVFEFGKYFFRNISGVEHYSKSNARLNPTEKLTVPQKVGGAMLYSGMESLFSESDVEKYLSPEAIPTFLAGIESLYAVNNYVDQATYSTNSETVKHGGVLFPHDCLKLERSMEKYLEKLEPSIRSQAVDIIKDIVYVEALAKRYGHQMSNEDIRRYREIVNHRSVELITLSMFDSTKYSKILGKYTPAKIEWRNLGTVTETLPPVPIEYGYLREIERGGIDNDEYFERYTNRSDLQEEIEKINQYTISNRDTIDLEDLQHWVSEKYPYSEMIRKQASEFNPKMDLSKLLETVHRTIVETDPQDDLQRVIATASNLLLAWQASDDRTDTETDKLFGLVSIDTGNKTHRRRDVVDYLEKASELGLPDSYRLGYWLVFFDGLEWFQNMMDIMPNALFPYMSLREKIKDIYTDNTESVTSTELSNYLWNLGDEINAEKVRIAINTEQDKRETKGNIFNIVAKGFDTIKNADSVIRGQKPNRSILYALSHLALGSVGVFIDRKLYPTASESRNLKDSILSAIWHTVTKNLRGNIYNSIDLISNFRKDAVVRKIEQPVSNTVKMGTLMLNTVPEFRYLSPTTISHFIRAIESVPVLGAFVQRFRQSVDQLYVSKDPAVLEKEIFIRALQNKLLT